MFNSRSSISISTFLSSLIGSIVRGRRSVRCGQTCEYRKARLILTHDPGEELFLGALHPAAALFREHIDIPELIAEHATYRRVLAEAGARVLTVRQILLDGTGADGKPADRTKLENLRRFAAGFLTFDTQNLSPETAGQQKEYRQSILAKTSPRDLVRIILRQPIIRLSETQINTGLKAEYSENPVMNLFYTRDQLITTAKGVVIGRMNSPQREKGCDILQFCLEKIGMKPLHRIDGEGAHLEGGDFYPFGDTAFIGCGMRTTQPAIDQLMEHDLLGCNRLVVVKDRLFSQAEMHLDTYFNIIDRNLVTLTARRMTTDPDSPDLLLADIYLRGANGVYTKTEEDVGFVELLRSRIGAAIIPISEEDADRLAGNFLTVGSRRIIGVAGQSEALRTELKHRGVKVTWVGLDNLCKGYGAAHCMTQVLRRR